MDRRILHTRSLQPNQEGQTAAGRCPGNSLTLPSLFRSFGERLLLSRQLAKPAKETIYGVVLGLNMVSKSGGSLRPSQAWREIGVDRMCPQSASCISLRSLRLGERMLFGYCFATFAAFSSSIHLSLCWNDCSNPV